MRGFGFRSVYSGDVLVFTGHLFYHVGFYLFRAEVKLNVPKKINLNFVGGMTIEQTFDRAPDGTRIITKDDINVDFKIDGEIERNVCPPFEYLFESSV